jgi:hypothetical protein
VIETVDHAFRLERLVMRGDVDAGYLQAIGVSSPDAVVAEVEDHLRALLRDVVCGHLALDLTGIADELLSRPARSTAEREAVAPHAPEPQPPPEPEFVVSRGQAAADAPHFEEPDPDAEDQDTDEVEAVAAGRVREVRGDDEHDDWDLDDDAADYSAAV